MLRFGKNKHELVAGADNSSVAISKRARVRRMLLVGGIAFVGLLIVVIAAQLLYPQGKSLPYATINGKPAGSKTATELTPLVQELFEGSTVKLVAGTASTEANLSALGSTVDIDKTIKPTTEYTLVQRLIPFSVLWLRPDAKTVYVQFDDRELSAVTGDLAGKMTSQPKNGEVGIDGNGEVIVTAAQDGASVTVENLAKAVRGGVYSFGTSVVNVSPEVTKPAVTNDMVNSVKSQIHEILSKPLVLKNSMDASAVYTPDKATKASWIVIGNDLKLSLDQGKIAAYTNQMVKAQIVAAGTTKVTLVDGVESGRIDAPAGRGVNLALLSSDVTKALFSGGPTTVTVQYSAIAPNVTYNRSYSSSQAGLQAYVSFVTSDGNIEISLQQLSGAGWSASGRSSKSVVAASTYKLFVSLLLFDKIASGQIKWSDSIQGTTVDGCLTNTIVVSANNCAEQWMGEWGRSNINAALYEKGISSATTFRAADAIYASAGDLQKLLIGLQNRSLFADSDANKLLGLMKRQVYRKGIPAGSAGIVADKVGFLWDYLNDAAIVYHPRGTYVLVIMTKGQSWEKIAEVTRQIESIMYP